MEDFTELLGDKARVIYKDEEKLIEGFKKSAKIKDVKELSFSGFN